ncbi:hypothetical protein [Tritonibacter scottomollicae]|uniref:DUF3618 domain-containing protein n=1 Tax=Tritonibacter scottomollicae TaxID=483013 RepID=A0ABZ0HKU5_TRISK|nr:hypothetical protein [Tritonibacter scottomollicae]WOI34580.1 hypothetical protein R1T40_07570 [Tritonibacter scottomollicae]
MSETLQSELDQIQTLLEKRLKLSGELADSLRRARRHLPHRMRRAADDLVAAEASFAHPRIAATLDQDGLLRKARRLRAYLAELDLKDRRKGRLLDIAATVGFALICVIALLVVVLRWRGFV